MFLLLACIGLAATGKAENCVYLIRGNGDALRVADTKLFWLTEGDLKEVARLRIEHKRLLGARLLELENQRRQVRELDAERARLRAERIGIWLGEHRANQARSRAEIAADRPRLEVLRAQEEQKRAAIEARLVTEYNGLNDRFLRLAQGELAPLSAEAEDLEQRRLEIGAAIIARLRKLSADERYPLNQFLLSENPAEVATILSRYQAEHGKGVEHLVRKAYPYKRGDVYAPYIYPRIQLYPQAQADVHALLDELIRNRQSSAAADAALAGRKQALARKQPSYPDAVAVETQARKDEALTRLRGELGVLTSYLGERQAILATGESAIIRQAEDAAEHDWEAAGKAAAKQRLDEAIASSGSENDLAMGIAQSLAETLWPKVGQQAVKTDINGNFLLPVPSGAVIGYYRNSVIDAQLGWYRQFSAGESITFTNSNGIYTDAYSIEGFAKYMLTVRIGSPQQK